MKTLVVVGPNRGDEQINELIREHHWVVLFEPLPDVAEFLRECCASESRAVVVEAACGTTAGVGRMTRYNRDGVSSSLGKCTKQAVEYYGGCDLSDSGEMEVRTVNLYDWLMESGIHEVETLVTDAQGMDLAILKTLEPMLSAGKIASVQCEADGDGFRHYDGLPDNSVAGFMAFMDQFDYEFSILPGRNDANPDLCWKLKERRDVCCES